MTDFAALGIRVDSSQAKAAFTELDKLADAGGRAEKAVDGLANASGKSKKELASTAREAAAATRSIDDYVKKLQISATTNGMGAREAKLYELAVQGASKAQLQAADSAIRMNEGYEKGVAIGQRIRASFIAVAAAASAAAVAIYAGTNTLIEQVAAYQGLAEKIGDTAVAVASIKTASDVSDVALDTIASASVRLTTSLSKTDDESKQVAKAIAGLGLSFKEFKALSPVEQLDAVARAMNGFADGSEKTAYAVALFGKAGADLIPFLNDLAQGSERYTQLTGEQIKAADDYTKAQARLTSEFQHFLQLAATEAVPALTDVTELLRSITREQTEGSTATELLKTAMDGVIVVFQTVAVVASDVIFVFKGVGREIGAIAAQLVALATLDFSGFRAISDAVTDDAKRARSELDALQARIMSVGQRKADLDASANYDDSAARVPGRQRLDVGGLNTDRTKKAKKDTSAAQEAKAQLAADINAIKSAQDAIIATYANSEKVLEAQRSASLVDERTYYTEKKRLLDLAGAAQETSLRQEIARLQQEKLTGKEAIENGKKIADAQARLTKAQATASTNSTVLSIQEAAAYQRVADAIREAQISAQDYLDTQKRRNDRDLAGAGLGNQNRDRNALADATDDKFLQQRQSLAGDLRRQQITKQQYETELAIINDAHRRALGLDEDYYARKLAQQQSFALGAREALQNYYDESQNVFKQTEEAVTNAFQGMEDALVSFVKTGKLDFKSLADSIISDIARIVVKQSITGPLAGLLTGMLGGGGGYSSADQAGLDGLIAGLSSGARAIGGPVSAGGLYQINEKGVGETFETAGRQYFMPATDGTVKTGGGAGGGMQNNYFTVGDVASVSTVRQAVNQAQAQASAALRRSRNYGGDASP